LRGKPNYVWDYEVNQKKLGRFGWKASQPTLRQQVAAAFLEDIGATNPIFRQQNCPPAQQACLAALPATDCTVSRCPAHDRPEVVEPRLIQITRYLQSVAVPARRDTRDADVERGETLFVQAQCSACHMASVKTDYALGNAKLADPTIHPYTDMLLHDLGEELADGRPDQGASGREWRTAPLWGIGLLRKINGHTNLLHDGRARNITEAILWHGGQAQEAREAFRLMARPDRAALVKFVESL
jgi:CxxC motif-containing protein (DUF1111 family)